MGTRFECVLVDDGRGEARLRAAGEAALAEIADLDAQLSRFRRDGLPARLAQRPPGTPLALDATTTQLFTEALEIWRESGGLFDIALAGAMDGAPTNLCPTEADRVGASAAHSCGPPFTVERDACTITATRPAALDLGGIAKGHAIDLASELLREAGVTCAFIHGGTSAVGALGAPPGCLAWLVEVAIPTHVPPAALEALPISGGMIRRRTGGADGGPSGVVVALRDRFLAVSAPHGRRSPRGHHIIDPRTGRAADCAAIAVIAGDSCRTCDAWTKPALILGGRPAGIPRQFEVWVAGSASSEPTGILGDLVTPTGPSPTGPAPTIAAPESS